MDILFWSGGKDSYLAYQFYKKSFTKGPITLLTTFNEENATVPHQEIPIERIRRQAKHLNIDLLSVSLPVNCSNNIYLKKVDIALKKYGTKRLLFGDWHLQDIRNWREENFDKLGYECFFPIWKKSLNNLLSVLFSKPVEVKISAVQEKFKPYIKVGEPYNTNFIKNLPEEIDPMGEKGEFHTEVIFL